MRRNAEGQVVGDVFLFQGPELSNLAQQLERFSGKVGNYNVVLDNLYLSDQKLEITGLAPREMTIAALRELAGAEQPTLVLG